MVRKRYRGGLRAGPLSKKRVLRTQSQKGQAAQRVLPDAKATIEDVGTPKPGAPKAHPEEARGLSSSQTATTVAADTFTSLPLELRFLALGLPLPEKLEREAKSRVERIMGDEHRQALLKALSENRWNRKGKLLPNLRLTYPSDDESLRIAELAKVNNRPWFGQHLHSIILDAHLNHASFLTLSIPQVRKALADVASQVNRLGRKLSKLDVGRGSRGSEDYAGMLIEQELALQQFEAGGMVLLPQYFDLLDALSSAAQRAAQRPMHVPKGAGGNPAFDSFIEDLLMAARMCGGGSWTNYRSADGTWTGTLLEALGILKQYLPQQRFFPAGKLGRSVEHIRKKLDDHIQKAR